MERGTEGHPRRRWSTTSDQKDPWQDDPWQDSWYHPHNHQSFDEADEVSEGSHNPPSFDEGHSSWSVVEPDQRGPWHYDQYPWQEYQPTGPEHRPALLDWTIEPQMIWICKRMTIRRTDPYTSLEQVDQVIISRTAAEAADPESWVGRVNLVQRLQPGSRPFSPLELWQLCQDCIHEDRQERTKQEIAEEENELRRKTEVQKKTSERLKQNERFIEELQEEQKRTLQQILEKELHISSERGRQEQRMRQLNQKDISIQQKSLELKGNEEECLSQMQFIEKEQEQQKEDLREIQEKKLHLSQEKQKQEQTMRQLKENEDVMQQKSLELKQSEQEFQQKCEEVLKQKAELEGQIRELQEIRSKKLEFLENELLHRTTRWNKRNITEDQDQDTLHREMQDLKSVVLGLERSVAKISAHMDDGSSAYSACSDSTWEYCGNPCCFLPDSLFTIITVDGQVLVPASMLYQGAQVQSATGKVMEVVNPPEQHQVHSVIELIAGHASLRVSPDHRVLVAGGGTVKAHELHEGDCVILDGVPARLTSCKQQDGPLMVTRITFKPDLPVAAVTRPPSILSKGFRKKPLRRGLKKKFSNADKDTLAEAAEDTFAGTEGYLTE